MFSTFVCRVWSNQFIRFLLIGGINTVFGLSLTISLLLLGLHYSLAVLFSTIAGVIFNFFSTGRFVFNNKSSKTIIRFIIIYGVVYGLNVLGYWVISKHHGSSIDAAVILTLPVAVISYFLNKHFVFGG